MPRKNNLFNMKYLVSLFIALFFGAWSSDAGAAPGRQEPAPAQSTLIFGETEWDFGTIEETDGRVSHRFTFTNGGDEAVIIERVSTSCGCTTSDYTRAPIAPGANGFITITFDPTGSPGQFEKSIHISSREGLNRNVLIVKGEVNGRPRTIVEEYPFAMSGGVRFAELSAEMGHVPQGRPISVAIAYVNTRPESATVSFEATPADGYLYIPRSTEIYGGNDGTIDVTVIVPSGKHYGKFSYRLRPIINGQPEAMAFTLSGTVVDDFTGMDASSAPRADLSPVFHDFKEVKRGAVLTKEITLKNNGRESLCVRHVAAQHGLSADLAPGIVILPGEQTRFNVILDTSHAEDHDDLYIRSLTLTLNDPNRPVKELRLAAKLL